MADEIKKDSAETTEPAKKAKKDKADKSKAAQKEKKANIFVRMGRSIKKFFQGLRGECKKVVWPDRKTVLKSSMVVIVAVVIIGAVIWLVDTGLSEVVKLLINLAEKTGEGETTTAAAGAIMTNLAQYFGV